MTAPNHDHPVPPFSPLTRPTTPETDAPHAETFLPEPSVPPMARPPTTPPPAPTARRTPSAPAEPRLIILLNANRVEVARIPGDRDFRVTWLGRVYEHVGEDVEGRWIYALQ